ncbi:MAG: hypothetical protein ACE5GW_01930 [Planctomycetota bacterium]
MTPVRQFHLRAGGVLLVATALAALALHDAWGRSGILCLTWSAGWAYILGVIGFRSMRRSLACERSKMAGVVLAGLGIRVLLLLVSQGAVFVGIGGEWGRRSLLSTVLLYLLVVGVEVITLTQGLKEGSLRTEEAPTGGATGNVSEEKKGEG